MTRNEKAILLLEDAFDCLVSLSDTDLDDFESEEEEREAVPEQYAARKIKEAIDLLKGLK